MLSASLNKTFLSLSLHTYKHTKLFLVNMLVNIRYCGSYVTYEIMLSNSPMLKIQNCDILRKYKTDKLCFLIRLCGKYETEKLCFLIRLCRKYETNCEWHVRAYLHDELLIGQLCVLDGLDRLHLHFRIVLTHLHFR